VFPSEFDAFFGLEMPFADNLKVTGTLLVDWLRSEMESGMKALKLQSKKVKKRERL
jgi:hypothetical protein